MKSLSIAALVSVAALTSLARAQAPAMLTVTGTTSSAFGAFSDPAMNAVVVGQPFSLQCQIGVVPQVSPLPLVNYAISGSVSLDVGLLSTGQVPPQDGSVFLLGNGAPSIDQVGIIANFPGGYQVVAGITAGVGSLLSSDLMTQNGSLTLTQAQATNISFFISEAGTGGNIGLTNLVLTLTVPPQLGTSYCATTPNSTTNSGSLVVAGSPVAAANDFLMLAHDLPPQVFGMALASRTQGSFMNPSGQGNICLAGTIGRFNLPNQLRLTDADGFTSFQVPLTMIPQGNGFAAVISGETWNVQFWHRDVVNGVQTSNLTNAISVPFL